MERDHSTTSSISKEDEATGPQSKYRPATEQEVQAIAEQVNGPLLKKLTGYCRKSGLCESTAEQIALSAITDAVMRLMSGELGMKADVPNHTAIAILIGWIYKRARSLTTNELKAQNRTVSLQTAMEAGLEPGTLMPELEQLLLTSQLGQLINEAQPPLSDKQRLVLYLVLQDFDSETIASVMGESIGNVDTMKHRALKKIRKGISMTTSATKFTHSTANMTMGAVSL